MKKPTSRPEWDDFDDRSEFAADGTVYGKVVPYLQAWQGLFLNDPVGIGASREEAKLKVREAYERWIS